MKPIRFLIMLTAGLVLLALSATLFMWSTLFFTPFILVPLVIAILKGKSFYQIENPHRKEPPWKP